MYANPISENQYSPRLPGSRRTFEKLNQKTLHQPQSKVNSNLNFSDLLTSDPTLTVPVCGLTPSDAHDRVTMACGAHPLGGLLGPVYKSPKNVYQEDTC